MITVVNILKMSNINYRYDIQGLRAIAVLLVFVFHLIPVSLSGGFIGVDIFFILSGFLVGGIIISKKEKETFSFIDFYIGRIKRIVPVFLSLLITVSLVGSYVYLSSDIGFLKKVLFHSAIFNSNNYFASLNSYFGASSLENPLLHTWTLSLEMQFYLLLPLIIIYINKKYLLRFLTILFIFLVFYSVVNSYYFGNIQSMYFSLPARIPEFVLGVIFAMKKETWQKNIFQYKNAISIFSFVAILLCAYFFDEHTIFPGVLVFIPVLATGLLLITEKSWVNNFISNKFFVLIGELSYSIYLWHWSIMAFIRYYNNKQEFNFVQILFIIGATLVLSYISYHLIENKYRKFTNKKFAIFFIPLIIILGISVFSISKLNSSFSGVPNKYSKPTFGLDSHANTFKRIQKLGDLSKDNKICLIGDSHALVYKGFLNRIAIKNNFSFTTISNNLYPTIPKLSAIDFKQPHFFDQYKKLISDTEKLIKDSNVIFISSIWPKEILSLESAFKDLVSNLKEHQKLVIIGDFPVFEKNPIKVIRGYIKNKKKYDFGEMKNSTLPSYIDSIVKNNKKVFYFKLLEKELLKQLPFVNDTLAYYDGGHLNIYGANNFADIYEEDFCEFLKENTIIKTTN